MLGLTATPPVLKREGVRRRLSVTALLLLVAAVGAPGAEAKSFAVTLPKEGVSPSAMAECRTSGPRIRRLTCLLYLTAPPQRARCSSGRPVYTITITRRGRPRLGFTCVRTPTLGLRQLRAGERFHSGPFVCRHLLVPTLDFTMPAPRPTGALEGRLRCRRGSGPAGFSYDAYGGAAWPV